MVKATTASKEKKWNYRFLSTNPKRRSHEGKYFRVQWLNDDGTDVTVSNGEGQRLSFGWIPWDDLDQALQAKYYKNGKTKPKKRATPRVANKKKKVSFNVQPVDERARKNAANIPPKTNNTPVPQTRVVGSMDGQPIHQTIRNPDEIRSVNASELAANINRKGYGLRIGCTALATKKILQMVDLLSDNGMDGGRFNMGDVSVCYYKNKQTYNQLMCSHKQSIE